MIKVGFEVHTDCPYLAPCVCDLSSELLDKLLDNLDQFETGLKIPIPNPNYRAMVKDMGSDLQSVIKEEFKIIGDDRVKAGIYSTDPRLYFIEYGTGLYGEGPGHIKKEIVAREVGNKKPFFFWEDETGTHVLAKHRGMHPIPIFRSSLFKLRINAKEIVCKYVEEYKMVADMYKLDIELI